MIQLRPTSSTPLPPRQVPLPPLRVLLIDTGREWRGEQRQVHLLAAGLRERGHEPLVVVTPRSPLHQRLRSEGIAVSAMTMANRLDLLAVRRLRRLISTWRPAVVHAHDARSHSLAVTALVGWRNSLPLVVTRRTPAVPRSLLRYGWRVSRFIAISGAVRDALTAAGVPEAQVALVYPGVSLPPDAGNKAPRDWRSECGWAADTVLAGVVGEFAMPGALPTLGAMMNSLDADVRARLRVIVLGGRAGGRIRIGGVEAFRAGFVHDIQQAIAGLDLMLHPGSAEGLGTAVIDAMSQGVPCVSFDGGSVEEIIEPGHSGLLVPNGDIGAYAAALSRVVSDSALRATLTKGGLRRALAFAPAHCIDGTVAVYRQAIP